MNASNLIPALGLTTLIVVLAAAVVTYLRFMRKPQNRHPLEGKHEHNIAARLDGEDIASPGEQPLR